MTKHGNDTYRLQSVCVIPVVKNFSNSGSMTLTNFMYASTNGVETMVSKTDLPRMRVPASQTPYFGFLPVRKTYYVISSPVWAGRGFYV